MDEYISRDAVIKRNHTCEKDCASCDFAIDGDSWCQGEIFVVDILRIPAADVAPVAHGKWTAHDTGNGILSIDEDTCSLCGSRFYQIAETGCNWHYCPNCGATMDLEADREAPETII